MRRRVLWAGLRRGQGVEVKGQGVMLWVEVDETGTGEHGSTMVRSWRFREEHHIEANKELTRKITKYYEEVRYSDAAELTEVVADAISRLLEDATVKEVIQQSSDFGIEESFM
ncbi:hypothetical protein TELCIR_08760 [Teladorsagia circumcincta]|uniref:Uncharacterized protein n=1 Tax=Teladorsagia circumcincta TaxID=45464 RepID=A0A2G9UGR4_TELCI|nr:hypothetical protein TELCIR_08760 [Teladorsagia circumcincta]